MGCTFHQVTGQVRRTSALSAALVREFVSRMHSQRPDQGRSLMHTLCRLSLGCWLMIVFSISVLAQTQPPNPAPAQTPEVNIIVGRQGVRFLAAGEVPQWRIEVLNQQGEVVFDSGFVSQPALEWSLLNPQGEMVEGGLYAWSLSFRDANNETTGTQRGHIILDRPSSAERVWVTSERRAGIGASSPEIRLTVVGNSDATLGGAELAREAPRHTNEGQVSEGRRTPTTRAVSEEKQQGTSAVAASPNRLAKFASDGATLIDSTVTESATGDIGIGTTSPGGVFDLQRSSTGDILQRLWNTGSGGAKLRYVAATGQTSQLQLTDGQEWLMAIAGNNATGMQFRVRDTSDPNSEAALAGAVRMTIARNGNVGIGTTLPQSRLHLSGTASSLGPFNGLFIDQRIQTAAVPGSIPFQVRTTFNSGNQLVTRTVLVNETGNLGVGTTSPSTSLHVAQSGDYQVRLENPAAGGGYWNIGQTDIQFTSGGGKLAFVPNTTDSSKAAVVFTNSGNVGIGTLTPTAGRLVVNDTSVGTGVAGLSSIGSGV